LCAYSTVSVAVSATASGRIQSMPFCILQLMPP
jgi:hypothetical protein